MNLKELIEYYDKIKDKIHIKSKHYDTLLLMRSKNGNGRVKGEPHIDGKHYWINAYNFKDNDIYDFFYAKDITAFRVILDEKIEFSAHISVICILGRENFVIDKNKTYFIYGNKKITNVDKIAKLCVDKLKNDYDCVIEPCYDGKFEECVLFLEKLAIKYECVEIDI